MKGHTWPIFSYKQTNFFFFFLYRGFYVGMSNGTRCDSPGRRFRVLLSRRRACSDPSTSSTTYSPDRHRQDEGKEERTRRNVGETSSSSHPNLLANWFSNPSTTLTHWSPKIPFDPKGGKEDSSSVGTNQHPRSSFLFLYTTIPYLTSLYPSSPTTWLPV